jgi:hypothetical protein
VTEADVAGAFTLTVMLPGADVTAYDVTFALSALAGADHVTVADLSPAVAATLVGADGVGTVGVFPAEVLGVTEFDGDDAGPVPEEFDA